MQLLAFCLFTLVSYTQNYRVGPGDLIKVSVVELKEMENQYRIDSLGMLTLPYLGRLEVKGMTVPELQTKITENLKEGFVNDPQVFVDLVEYNYRPISVIGAVHEPGKLNLLNHNVDLIEAITQAGGVLPNASDKIFVIRKTPEGIGETLEVSYTELMLEGRTYLNIPIFPGDTINIPVERPLVVSVIGEVNRAGEFKFSRDSKITILRVIAAAGGFTDYAKRGKLLIKREGKSGSEEFKIDIESLADNQQADFVMEHNDVLIVP